MNYIERDIVSIYFPNNTYCEEDQSDFYILFDEEREIEKIQKYLNTCNEILSKVKRIKSVGKERVQHVLQFHTMPFDYRNAFMVETKNLGALQMYNLLQSSEM